jgi:three-Cys-motif partner protein
MAVKHYEWDGQDVVEAHSLAKHDLIHNYIVHYIRTLTSRPAMGEFKLTLVDGFAGGGLYRDRNGATVLGSPLRMLKAVQEAKAWRRTAIPGPDLDWKIQFYFVERDERVLQLLKKTVIDEFGQSFAESHVRFVASTFQVACPQIIEAIKGSAKKLRAGQGGRAIFFLDQYGYKDLPFPLLRSILRTLPNAELVFNFGVDDLIDYLPNGPYSKALANIGLDGSALQGENRGHPRWRQFLQAQVAQQLVEQIGAKTFTPFFIRRDAAHRDYWLEPRARERRDEAAALEPSEQPALLRTSRWPRPQDARILPEERGAFPLRVQEERRAA